jgi:hypothetical protein
MAVVWQFGEKDKGLIAKLLAADGPFFESLFASKSKDLNQRGIQIIERSRFIWERR